MKRRSLGRILYPLICGHVQKKKKKGVCISVSFYVYVCVVCGICFDVLRVFITCKKKTTCLINILR